MTFNDFLIFVVPPVIVLTTIIGIFLWGAFGNTDEQ